MTRFRFRPAAPGEDTVYGACAPGWGTGGREATAEWIEYVRDRGVRRVVCLLSDRQVADRPALLDRYAAVFGEERVAHVPIPDHHLPERERLESALSVLRAADRDGERAVVHCLAGIGRTGVTLAAWLVAERGYDPREAIATVEENGRRPTDAVRAGNATESDLHQLLAGLD